MHPRSTRGCRQAVGTDRSFVTARCQRHRGGFNCSWWAVSSSARPRSVPRPPVVNIRLDIGVINSLDNQVRRGAALSREVQMTHGNAPEVALLLSNHRRIPSQWRCRPAHRRAACSGCGCWRRRIRHSARRPDRRRRRSAPAHLYRCRRLARALRRPMEAQQEGSWSSLMGVASRCCRAEHHGTCGFAETRAPARRGPDRSGRC